MYLEHDVRNSQMSLHFYKFNHHAIVSRLRVEYVSMFLSIIFFQSIFGFQTDRIIGGNSESISNRKYLAGVYYKGSYKCAGAIISQNYVLTAAHCDYRKTGEKASTIKIRGGMQNSGQVIVLIAYMVVSCHLLISTIFPTFFILKSISLYLDDQCSRKDSINN